MIGKIIGWIVLGLIAVGAAAFLYFKRDFVKECYQELKKVSWPSREIALNSAIITVMFVVVFSLTLAILDYLINLVVMGLVR